MSCLSLAVLLVFCFLLVLSVLAVAVVFALALSLCQKSAAICCPCPCCCLWSSVVSDLPGFFYLPGPFQTFACSFLSCCCPCCSVTPLCLWPCLPHATRGGPRQPALMVCVVMTYRNRTLLHGHLPCVSITIPSRPFGYDQV